ncbi:unnamed protein product [Closterium sp. NIES-65]|nr:unnamed protein product [Closterium sp. NIES-65]
MHLTTATAGIGATVATITCDATFSEIQSLVAFTSEHSSILYRGITYRGFARVAAEPASARGWRIWGGEGGGRWGGDGGGRRGGEGVRRRGGGGLAQGRRREGGGAGEGKARAVGGAVAEGAAAGRAAEETVLEVRRVSFQPHGSDSWLLTDVSLSLPKNRSLSLPQLSPLLPPSSPLLLPASPPRFSSPLLLPASPPRFSSPLLLPAPPPASPPRFSSPPSPVLPGPRRPPLPSRPSRFSPPTPFSRLSPMPCAAGTLSVAPAAMVGVNGCPSLPCFSPASRFSCFSSPMPLPCLSHALPASINFSPSAIPTLPPDPATRPCHPTLPPDPATRPGNPTLHDSLGLIFGRSGGGKTTLLQLLSGLTTPTQGTIAMPTPSPRFLSPSTPSFSSSPPPCHLPPPPHQLLSGLTTPTQGTIAMPAPSPPSLSASSSPASISPPSPALIPLSRAELSERVGIVFQFPERCPSLSLTPKLSPFPHPPLPAPSPASPPPHITASSPPATFLTDGVLAEQSSHSAGLHNYFLTDSVLAELTFGWPSRVEDIPLRQALAARVQAALIAVGLMGVTLDTNPRALSGGNQRRLALAIQLVRMPELLLLDEPLAGLDWRARTDVVRLLAALKRERSILVVSHDLRELAPLVDRSWRMQMGGRLREEPLPAAVSDDEGDVNFPWRA